MVVGKLVPERLIKLKTEHISRSRASDFIQFIFIVCPIGGLPKHIKTKLLATCFYLKKSFFKKTKRGLRLVSLPYFLHDF